MNLPIWSYWVGPKPGWIELCLETLQRHNPTIQILDDTVWDTLYDGPVSRETVRRQAYNVQSDFLRAWLLVKFGGIWVDADCIGLRTFTPLEELLDRHDFVAYRKGRVMSALLACRSNSRIAREYYAEMVRRLRPGNRLSGMALGPWVLRRAIRQTGAPLALVSTDLVHPAQGPRFGYEPRLLSQDGLTVKPAAYCCMLTHRAIGYAARLQRDQLLASQTVLGGLFRRALDLPAPAVKSIPLPRVLIGALSGDDHADRRRWCLDTWIPALEAHGVKTVFLRGRTAAPDEYNLPLPVDDRRDTLSLKTLEFLRWAVQRDDWDWLFKCDDDTFIHPSRFVAALPGLRGDYIGGRWRPTSHYASGGAGYFLSRRAAQLLVKHAADWPAVYAEDKLVGARLAAASVPLVVDPRFCWSHRARHMRSTPDMITTHGIRTRQHWYQLAEWVSR
jgi:GR25 family glycosyltransferase involved in LPS biosynthesis